MSLRTVWRSLAWIAFYLLHAVPAGRASGEERTVRVDVRVIAQVGGEVQLDAGSDRGLVAGDRVRLELGGAAPREAVVVATAADWSRARLEGSGPPIAAGTLGTLVVPAARLEREAKPAQQGPSTSQAPAPTSKQATPQAEPQQGPPHPGWSAPPEEWSQDLPLLAPMQARDGEPSEVEWRGFAFLDAQTTFDDERDYGLARTGVNLEARDLFTPGGLLEIDVEGFTRVAELSDGEDEHEARARIDRLSYLWGGDRAHGDSFQV